MKKVSLITILFFAYFLNCLFCSSVGKLRQETETRRDASDQAILVQAGKQSDVVLSWLRGM